MASKSFWAAVLDPDNARSTEQRLARLEAKVDRIIDALGMPREDPTTGSVEDFLRRGMKINAIRVYREQTGLGLRESKDAVEALEAEMKARGLI